MTERTIDIAGIAIRFAGDDAAAEVIDRRYAAFVRAPVPGDDPIVIELRLRPPAAAPVDDAVAPFSVTRDADSFVLHATGVRASISFDRMSVRLDAPLAERPIDAVVRILLASHLLRRDGLLVHASAVKIGGRAWVFAGASGVGKTTLGTTLEGELLCDEAVAVVPDGEQTFAHATPYWRARPGQAPVAGLLFPVRAAAPSWSELTPARALARLLSSVGPLLPDAMPDAMRAAHRIVGAVRCAEICLSSIADIRDWLQPRLC